MASYNKVLLMGNLTRDPELRYTPSGTAICEFGIAVNESWTPKGGGEKKEKVHFFNCVAWAKTAEIVAQYFKKGKPIFIEGKLSFEQWQDPTGGKRSTVKVTVERFQFIGGKRDDESFGGPPSDEAAQATGGVTAEDDIAF
jgi:single-strand DNA-binding protein